MVSCSTDLATDSSKMGRLLFISNYYFFSSSIRKEGIPSSYGTEGANKEGSISFVHQKLESWQLPTKFLEYFKLAQYLNGFTYCDYENIETVPKTPKIEQPVNVNFQDFFHRIINNKEAKHKFTSSQEKVKSGNVVD